MGTCTVMTASNSRCDRALACIINVNCPVREGGREGGSEGVSVRVRATQYSTAAEVGGGEDDYARTSI